MKFREVYYVRILELFQFDASGKAGSRVVFERAAGSAARRGRSPGCRSVVAPIEVVFIAIFC